MGTSDSAGTAAKVVGAAGNAVGIDAHGTRNEDRIGTVLVEHAAVIAGEPAMKGSGRRPKSRRSSVTMRIAAVMIAMLATIGIAATPAYAVTYGWNYISLPTWAGNCPQGGSVKYLFVAIGDSWSGGDSGDDLVYGRVRLFENQAVTAQGLCYNGSRSYWGPASQQTIRPTRNNQTWWVGPAGVWHN